MLYQTHNSNCNNNNNVHWPSPSLVHHKHHQILLDALHAAADHHAGLHRLVISLKRGIFNFPNECFWHRPGSSYFALPSQNWHLGHVCPLKCQHRWIIKSHSPFVDFWDTQVLLIKSLRGEPVVTWSWVISSLSFVSRLCHCLPLLTQPGREHNSSLPTEINHQNKSFQMGHTYVYPQPTWINQN